MSPSNHNDTGNRGYIIPIGGAEEKLHNPEILDRFIEVCGGNSARIAIIPTASELEDTGRNYEKLFRKIGVQHAKVLSILTREDCQRSEFTDYIEKSDGVFMTGGNQLRLSTTLGGTVSFLSTRYIFHDFIQHRFPKQIAMVNKGVEKEGAFYVFGLRMIPVIPFWTLNLAMGLTSMRVTVFMLATMLGMIPVLLILTYTGSQLGEIETFSVAAVFTPGVILSLVLLASFPFIGKGLLGLTRRITNKEAN